MTAQPFTVGELYDRAVAHGGDRVAITDGRRSLTYRELGDQALRLATALQSLGLGHGDRVAFLMANCAEYVACEYAVARIGATRVPLAVLLGDDDHSCMMDFARGTLLETSSMDGRQRLKSFREAKRYPILVSVSQEESELLRPSRIESATPRAYRRIALDESSLPGMT